MELSEKEIQENKRKLEQAKKKEVRCCVCEELIVSERFKVVWVFDTDREEKFFHESMSNVQDEFVVCNDCILNLNFREHKEKADEPLMAGVKSEALKGKKIGVIDIGEGIDHGILDLDKGSMKIPKEIQLNTPMFDFGDVKSAVKCLKKSLKTIMDKNLNVEQRTKVNRFIDEIFYDVTKED